MAIEFSETMEAALKRFMQERGIDDRDQAIAAIVRERLETGAYIEQDPASLFKPTPSEGSGRDPQEVQYPSYFKDRGSI